MCLMQTSKNFLILLSIIFVFLTLISHRAVAIEWAGGDTIDVDSDEPVTVTSGHYTVSAINVKENCKLVIASDASITIDSSNGNAQFSNNGEITVNGTMLIQRDVSITNNGTIEIINISEQGENGYKYVGVSTRDQFNNLLYNGKIIVGGPSSTFRSGLHIATEGNTGELNFTTDQLKSITNNLQNGQIALCEWGNVRTGYTPLQITGNELSIGPITYDQFLKTNTSNNDVRAAEISRFRSADITLIPENNSTITLSSGVLQVGKGDSGNDNQDAPAILKIGQGGKDTLNIAGGVLLLGAKGNQNGEVEVRGDISIGNNDITYTDSALIALAGGWVLQGNLTLNESGYLEVGKLYTTSDGKELKSSLTITQDFHNNGKYDVEENSLIVEGTTYFDKSAINVSNKGEYRSNNIVGSTHAKINISGGTIIASNIKFNNGEINFDPPFVADGDTSNASMGGLSFDSNNIDARINVGQNSMVTLGSDDPEWLRTQIGNYQTNYNLLWGRDVTSALAIRTPQTLSSIGGLNVDGTWTSGGAAATANVARFADKSLLVVDASGTKGQTALSGGGTAALKVESGAKLLVTDAVDGDSVTVTSDFASSDVSPEGWSANLKSSTPLQAVTGELIDPATGKYVVRVGEDQKPEAAFPMLSSELAAVVDKTRQTGLNTNAASAGRRFISRAVDNRYIGDTDTLLAAATIESAARMAVVGAVPQMTMTANNAAGSAITQRTGLAQPDGQVQSIDANGNLVKEQSLHAKGLALWVMPLYQSTNGFGMEAGNFDYDFNGALGGVALGGDYTFENSLRAGISFNIGGGYARGTGDLNKTTNNMNFWGVGAYAGWTQNNFGLTADVNYTSTYNKLKQEVPASMQMGDLKSDVRAWAISTGLRAEYKFETDFVNIVPHAGFRFLNLNTDSYDIKSNGAKVINGDSFAQNIWTFPIGVSFSKDFELQNNWKLKPLVDLNVTPAAGDIKAKTKIRFTGVDQEAEIDTKMMDYITYGGTAGLEFGNDTVSFGVDYNGQFGAESSAHGVFGTFKVEF